MKKYLLLISLLISSFSWLYAQKSPYSTKQIQQKNLVTASNENLNRSTRVIPFIPKIYFPRLRRVSSRSKIDSDKLLENKANANNGYASSTFKNADEQMRRTGNSKIPNRVSNSQVQGSEIKVPMTYKITRDYKDVDGSKGYKGYFILTDKVDTWNPDATYWPDKKDSTYGDDNYFKCKYVKQSFTAQSTTFMNAAVNISGANLIPGTIYSYEDLSKGNFREYAEGRNPVNIWTPVFVGNASSVSSNQFLVQEPNGRNISQGISNLVRTFTADQAGAKAVQQTIYSDNRADLAMLVSAGGSYGGFSGFGISKINQSQHHIYITYDDVKLLFNIDVDRPSNGYFAEGKIPVAGSPLVVVKNVTYGTRILANLDISTTNQTNYDSLHLNYTDGVDQGTVDFSLLAKDTTISVTGNIMVVGTGINIPIVSVQNLQNFQQQLSDIFAKSSFRTALPIQYQLSDLDGNLLGIESLTDQFVDPQCAPEKDVYTLQSVFFSLTTGADGKNDDSQFILSMGTDDGRHIVVNGTPISPVIGQFTDEQTEYKSGSTLPGQPITLKDDGNHPNGYTLDDFQNGGYVYFYLHCADKAYKSDDWDILRGTVTFNFMSQKGVPYRANTAVNIPNFRLSSSTNGFTEGQQVIWFDPKFSAR